MRRNFLYVLLLIANTSFAQQTVFNVPSLDITRERTWYFQQGIVFTHMVGLNTTLNYGLGSLMEAGMNINHLNINTRRGDDLIQMDEVKRYQNPNVMLNLQKGFQIYKYLRVSAGSMTGVNIGEKVEQIKLSDFSFINTQSLLTKRDIKLIVGGYYANKSFSGDDNIGLMLGTKIPIVKDKLWFNLDYISGKSHISVIATGMELRLFETWSLALGGQLPGPENKNNVGVIFQITKEQ